MKKYRNAGLLGAVALIFALSACGQKQGAAVNKSIVISLAAAWDNVNTLDFTTDYGNFVKSLIFDRLTALDRTGGVKPRLLSSREINDERTRITGHIDPKAQ
jgi:ABC-type oligopeptide transport system substrate-binding subunit